MTDTAGSAVAAADGLFDKYVLPKVALTVILAASLAGTAASVRLTGGWAPVATLGTWGYLVAVGVLAGGLCWKHGFVRPADLADDAGAYCERMSGRFDRIAVGASAVVAVGGAVALARYAAAGLTTLVGALAATLVALVLVVAGNAARSAPVERRFRSPVGLAALGLAGLAVALTATAEVALRGGDFAAVGVRILHLSAFAAWVGGAVWNIFVAVPTGKERPTVGTAAAAGQQLERFRRAVRLIIPTLLLTGLYQAVDALGTSLGTYLASVVGLVVLAKAGSIGVLFAVFKLCPMWRACSPIDGVCDISAGLDGAGETAPSESVHDD